MGTTEIILALIALVSAPLSAWLSGRLQRRKYETEIAKLQAEVKAAQINTRGDELENVKTAMDILMEQVVEPLKREINGIRREVARLRRAVELANHCTYNANCPVRHELQKPEAVDPDPPPRQRQHATHKKIRDEPRAYPNECGETETSFD